MRRVGIIFGALTLVACGHQHEPAAGGAGAAELRASAGTTITRIDDRAVPSGAVANLAEQAVSAPAGAHKVIVFTAGGHGAGEWTVPLTLAPGHAYRFGQASATALSLRVVDETSGQVLYGPSVSAAVPPTPPPARR
jgi:hypothetical protein